MQEDQPHHVRNDLKAQFPGRQLEIETLLRCNKDFREVCIDFEICNQVLEDLLKVSPPDASRIKEYKILRDKLLSEISYYLNHEMM